MDAIIIDDEPFAIEVIKSLVTDIPFIAIKASFTKPLEALEYLRTNSVDVIFLDIKMPGLSGIDFLRSLSNPPMVIFTTAYNEHAVESFDLDAIDYLLKPFSFARLLKACNKAAELHHLRSNKNSFIPKRLPAVFLKSGYEKVKVELSELLYVESTGNYVHFNLANENVLARMTMTEAEEMLPKTDFLRIHRSFIVSTSKITRIDKRSVWLGNKELPIGLSYLTDIEQIISNNTNH